jgi:uncharacterized protein YjdB
MKQKLKIMASLLLTAAFAAVLSSCSEDEPKPVEATDVTLDRETLDLVVGGESATLLKATVTPDNATDKTITWTSSAPAVATVAGGVVTAVAKGTATISVPEVAAVTDGLVMAVAEGTATITATAANGKKAACEVTVEGFEPGDNEFAYAGQKAGVDEAGQIYYVDEGGVLLVMFVLDHGQILVFGMLVPEDELVAGKYNMSGEIWENNSKEDYRP